MNPRWYGVLTCTTIAPGQYNQVGLAMYELPNMILAWVLLLLRPRDEGGAGATAVGSF